MGNKPGKPEGSAKSASPQQPANTVTAPPASKPVPSQTPNPVASETNNAKSGVVEKAEIALEPASTASAAAAGTGPVDYSHFNSKLTINDFDLLKVLGKGSFGKVMLVKRKDDTSGKLYALKTLRKEALVKRNQLAHTSTERFILQNINCPYLVHLVYAFQTADKLYMVLNYMAGGELFFWLKKDRRFSDNRVKLYGAEITLALDVLHSANIVYRDLKPENILLDEAGHIRITDFGLAKGGITTSGPEGGTKTFCGTPEYLAPEILENKGHGKAVDWWALGTLMYEMLTGLPPFYDTNVQRMYHKILHEPLRFPKGEGRQVSEPAKELLRGLLERKIAMRTGSGPGDAEELFKSAYLSDFNKTKLTNKEYPAEFRPPAATSQTDVRNFDKEFTSEMAADSMVVSHMSETMVEKTNFEGFTYKGDNKIQ